MFDVSNRNMIPIRLVAGLPQVSPCGMAPHRSTPARWALYGIGGVRLESWKIAGRRYTTAEAVDRFLARCAQATFPQHQNTQESLS